MNYNQNYEYEEEIDLIKLILFIFSKWRNIVPSVLIGAVIGCAMAVIKPESTIAVKTILIYAFVGAFSLGVVSAGVWFVAFFASGKLYAVADIERKFRIKSLGKVAVCDCEKPIDKWIFNKTNGLYSEFPKDVQEKIVLLNIKNEFKKNENIKKVMLVSSLGIMMKDSVDFIKTGLENAGYIVSDCVNIVGRPDIIEKLEEYDAAIIVEKTIKSRTKFVVAENDIINEYMGDNSYIVLL